MAENLKTTKYQNGDLIGTTTPITLDISDQITPKYHWDNYDCTESNVQTYGKLYTWYAVTDNRGVCPAGWHIPTEVDLEELTTFLGGINEVGSKLKESGISHWISPRILATNESGFSALPGSDRAYMVISNLMDSAANSGHPKNLMKPNRFFGPYRETTMLLPMPILIKAMDYLFDVLRINN